MTDPNPAERPTSLRRQVWQRLEALRRAGLDRMPRPPAFEPGPTPRLASTPPPPRAVESAAPEARPEAVRPIRPASPAPTPDPRPSIPAGSLFDEPDLGRGPALPREAREMALQATCEMVANCTRCPALVESRTWTVFGEGSPEARLMFIGEAPGATEDRTGRPFVGPAGQLLDDMITKGMGLRREDVYITNVVKCHPPENRDPMPDEVAHCRGYLEDQIAFVRPQFLCILGRVAAQALLETGLSLGRLRGRWHQVLGVRAIVTYHPAFLLRKPESKREAWEDLKTLMRAMEIRPPDRKGSGS